MPDYRKFAAVIAIIGVLGTLAAGCTVTINVPDFLRPKAAATPTTVQPTLTATGVPTATPIAPPPLTATQRTVPATTTPPPITITPRPATPTPSPIPNTPTPGRTPSPTPAGNGSISVQSVTLQTYPYERYLQDAVDAASGIRYQRLDWPTYEASAPRAAPRAFAAVVLENEALRLTFLPDLGGRLFRAVHKPTGRDLFYVNPVLKPTRWGPAQQGWWLGTGGIEWCLPVDEHGLEWGQAWEYSTARIGAASTITLWDSGAADRLRARVTVTLPDGASSFNVTMRLENPTGAEKRYQFWLNAMVSGPGGRVPEGLRFLFPTDAAIVHSTDNAGLPAPRETFPWPVVQGRDLGAYSAWQGWLGVFAANPGGRMGVYDPVSRLGIIRTYPAGVARGAKLFAGRGLDPGLWTDGGSTYVELWGGANRTFFPEDDRILAPGAAIEWTETWSVTTTGF